MRKAVLVIAGKDLQLRPTVIRDVLCSVLKTIPDRDNWSDYPNIWEECQRLIQECPWYRVYDFVEDLYNHLNDKQKNKWEGLINEYFVETGVGWKMAGGLLEIRGTEFFEAVVDTARGLLDSRRLCTASQEISEALRDLSRRPEPDVTGAIQHAMAALECTAREVTGNPRATLGYIIKHCDDMIPKPLDDVVAKLWGYASEHGRHLREGRIPDLPEAVLIVGASSMVISYIVSKISKA